MRFTALVEIMPLKLLLDPQGRAVERVMKNDGYSDISNVRIGKHITFDMEASSKEEAAKKVEELCTKILVNPTMEYYQFQVVQQG